MTYVVWKGLDAAKQEVEHLSRKAISDVRALNQKMIIWRFCWSH